MHNSDGQPTSRVSLYGGRLHRSTRSLCPNRLIWLVRFLSGSIPFALVRVVDPAGSHALRLRPAASPL